MRPGVRAVVKLRGLWTHPKTGAHYYRRRAGGQTTLVRLPDLPIDHPDFIAAWAAAARRQPIERPPAAGTLASSWRALIASDQFHHLRPATRNYIKREGALTCAQAGAVKIGAIAERHVRADLAKASNPSARLKAWRTWARYCIAQGWIHADPSHAIRLHQKSGTGHPAWSPDEISAFRDRHPLGTTARAIMELTYWTGARISDVVLIGPQHIGRDGVLAFRQTKTGDLSYVPWTCSLPDYAAGLDTDRQLCRAAIAHLPRGLTFLQTRDGRARSHKAAGHDLAEACRAMNLARSAHGLRKSRAVALAEAGASPAQIGAWTGHRSLSEIVHYTREMDRRAAVRGTDPEQAVETLPAQSGNSEK